MFEEVMLFVFKYCSQRENAEAPPVSDFILKS